MAEMPFYPTRTATGWFVSAKGWARKLELPGEVTVHLPAPQIADPRVDNERTEVVSRQRGVFTRIGGVFSDQPVNDQKLYLLAEAKLRTAAEASKLKELAEKNTESMLQALLRSLGFERITIIFDPPAVTG